MAGRDPAVPIELQANASPSEAASSRPTLWAVVDPLGQFRDQSFATLAGFLGGDDDGTQSLRARLDLLAGQSGSAVDLVPCLQDIRSAPSPSPRSARTVSTSALSASLSSAEISRTCRTTSASPFTFLQGGARNAATNSWGRSEIKPTVSRTAPRRVRRARAGVEETVQGGEQHALGQH